MTGTGSILLALWLACVSLAQGTILRVPEDFPAIQPAMNASADGDTVLVARGTWAGLYVSPVHSLTLCSNYIFSHDSTDINETILDGEYAGTILDIVTAADERMTVWGFTMTRGQGTRPDIYAYCDKGGAINMEHSSNGIIRDMIFHHCRAPYAAAILNHGNVCSASSATGRLEIRNIACYNNQLEAPSIGQSGCIYIRSRFNTLIIDSVMYYGDGPNSNPFFVNASRKDTLKYSNISLMNCESQSSFGNTIGNVRGVDFSNIRVINQPGTHGGTLFIASDQLGIQSSYARINRLEIIGTNMTDGVCLSLQCDEPTLEIDSLIFHHNRSACGDDFGAIMDFWSINNRATVRHLIMHDNVSGDSISQVGIPLLRTYRTDIWDAYVYNNRVILPSHPDPSGTGGNFVGGAMIRDWYGPLHFENLVFENNVVEDLDDYSFTPDFGYYINYGRELKAWTTDSLTLRNVVVRNSRQANACPETLAGDGISLTGVGSTMELAGAKVEVKNVLLENCDDGGFGMAGTTLLMDNIILRNVGRSAFYIGDSFSPPAPPHYRFRNVHVENVDASQNLLPPSHQRLSHQAVLQVAVVNDYQGINPLVELENVTVTGCDSMRHLFNFYQPLDLHVRNSLFYNNNYQQLVEWNLPITQDWQYNLVEEAVPGEYNLVGLDPQFATELGPPFLSPLSPCIDAGNPDPDWNDLEDPANPGLALWPSQGGLRSDIGYTGGPHAALLDTNWVELVPWEPHVTPRDFSLGAPWPNPFNPVTQIPFTLARPTRVRISVHNLLGQEVAVLTDRSFPVGAHRVAFHSRALASGVYLVTLETSGKSETRSVTLLR